MAVWRHMATGILVSTGSGNGFVARRNQAITWTNVDLSPARLSDIHPRAISQEMPQTSNFKFSLKITYFENFIQISNRPMSLMGVLSTLWVQ